MSQSDNNKPTILPLAGQKKDAEEPKDPAQADYEAGKNFLGNGDMAQAANAFHNALIGFEQSNNEEGVANANSKLAEVCVAHNEFDKALAHLQKAFDICQRHDDLASLLMLRKEIAKCHRGLQQFDKAINLYLDMLDIHEKLDNPGSAVDVLVLMAETYNEMGDLANAVDAYKTAASIHTNFKHTRHAQKLLDEAKAIEEKMN